MIDTVSLTLMTAKNINRTYDVHWMADNHFIATMDDIFDIVDRIHFTKIDDCFVLEEVDCVMENAASAILDFLTFSKYEVYSKSNPPYEQSELFLSYAEHGLKLRNLNTMETEIWKNEFLNSEKDPRISFHMTWYLENGNYRPLKKRIVRTRKTGIAKMLPIPDLIRSINLHPSRW